MVEKLKGWWLRKIIPSPLVGEEFLNERSEFRNSCEG